MEKLQRRPAKSFVESRFPPCLVSQRSRVRAPLWPSSFNERNKMFLPCSRVKIQYCGEPSWPIGSVLCIRLPGIEFRIRCLEGSFISFISPSSEIFLAQFGPHVASNPIHYISFSKQHHMCYPCFHNHANVYHMHRTKTLNKHG